MRAANPLETNCTCSCYHVIELIDVQMLKNAYLYPEGYSGQSLYGDSSPGLSEVAAGCSRLPQIMSLNEIDNVVVLFPNPEWTDVTFNKSNAVVVQLRSNISYAEHITENLLTLSTKNANQAEKIGGFLYVPDLKSNDNCFNISKEYVPSNVTRQRNLPPTDYALIGLAPWINEECTRAYLGAARHNPIRAFLFYVPDDGTDQPPPPESEVWKLSDHSWRTTNRYPVYAISGSVGSSMMHVLSLYSGNMTDVPFGHEISELPNSDPRDYVRIYTRLSIISVSKLPALWVFIFIVLGAIALVAVGIFLTTYLIQKGGRRELCRRIEYGEVDLEALGIKRMPVLQEYIDKLPLFIYNMKAEPPSLDAADDDTGKFSNAGTDKETAIEHDVEVVVPSHPPERESSASAITNFQHKFLPYAQPTCSVCLNEFESGETTIRELPCGHIYHPECIDYLLSTISPLCPLCKQSVLPGGYFPVKITNNMVRRERNIRRLRQQMLEDDAKGYPRVSQVASVDPLLLSVPAPLQNGFANFLAPREGLALIEV
ncbi:hypothetical protein B7494_g6349 [Chlorociboria aeruginascens]|nr:hypothetical protein B7494_g6349 [Chlorociboria aeruginascens]